MKIKKLLPLVALAALFAYPVLAGNDWLIRAVSPDKYDFRGWPGKSLERPDALRMQIFKMIGFSKKGFAAYYFRLENCCAGVVIMDLVKNKEVARLQDDFDWQKADKLLVKHKLMPFPPRNYYQRFPIPLENDEINYQVENVPQEGQQSKADIYLVSSAKGRQKIATVTSTKPAIPESVQVNGYLPNFENPAQLAVITAYAVRGADGKPASVVFEPVGASLISGFQRDLP